MVKSAVVLVQFSRKSTDVPDIGMVHYLTPAIGILPPDKVEVLIAHALKYLEGNPDLFRGYSVAVSEFALSSVTYESGDVRFFKRKLWVPYNSLVRRVNEQATAVLLDLTDD